MSDGNDPERALPRPEGPACGGSTAEQQRRPVRHGGLALNPETVPDHDPAGLTVHDSKGLALMQDTSSDSGFAGSLGKGDVEEIETDFLFFSLFF